MVSRALRYKFAGAAAAVLSLLMIGGVPALAVTTVPPVSPGSDGLALGSASRATEFQPTGSSFDNSMAASGAGQVSYVRGIADPQGITSGPDGALWFTNQNNSSIGRISTTGAVTNYAGHGIDRPTAITAGPGGTLWFINGNNSIGRITTTGVVSTYKGTGIDGPNGITPGPDGAMWFTNYFGDSIGRITTSGVVTTYTGPGVVEPGPITAISDGTLWFTNLSSVGRITTSGVITTYTDDGIRPDGITQGPDGPIYGSPTSSPTRSR